MGFVELRSFEEEKIVCVGGYCSCTVAVLKPDDAAERPFQQQPQQQQQLSMFNSLPFDHWLIFSSSSFASFFFFDDGGSITSRFRTAAAARFLQHCLPLSYTLDN